MTNYAEARQLTDYPVEWPDIAEELHIAGTTIVQVELSERGTVLNASVARSSGNALLDEAASEATRQQEYAPEVRDCTSIAGSYLIEVEFAR